RLSRTIFPSTTLFRSYREFRARLDRELGLEPTSETRLLETAILRQQEIQSLLPRAIRPTQRDAAPQSIRLLGRTSELVRPSRRIDRKSTRLNSSHDQI